MDFTDYLYFGLRDGRCVASGWKQSGTGADRFNAKMVSGWIKRGLDVVTLHRDDPAAKVHFDQMWDDANAAVVAARAGDA